MTSLALRTASEFQAFCRDLHDEASEYFAIKAGGENLQLVGVLRTRLTAQRKLDRGNATPGNLGDDFGRFGMSFWGSLHARHRRAAGWNTTTVAGHLGRLFGGRTPW